MTTKLSEEQPIQVEANERVSLTFSELPEVEESFPKSYKTLK